MEITSDFYNHVMNMDYATVENPEIQSIKERASDTLVKVADVSTGMTTLISAVISLLLISSIISVLNPLIILLVILILIINSAVTKKVNYKNHIIGMELSKNDLFLWAYSYMMGHLSYAQEVRLFKLNKLLIDGYKKYKHENDEKNHHDQNCGGRDIILMLTDVFQQVVLYAYLIFNVLYRGLPVGSIAIFISTVGQFSGTLSSVFNAYLYLESESFREPLNK